MKLPAIATVDRLLQPLVATTVLLGLSLLWQGTYDQSCLALASPALVYVAILYGLLEYRLERKRFAVSRGAGRGAPHPYRVFDERVPEGRFL